VSARAYLSIGDVLTLLRQEFPDITISKIRFLESQGLVNPERSPSGYRKFYEPDVERLRWVLRQQREHFLPLKVIRDRLARSGDIADVDDALEDGTEDAFDAEYEEERNSAHTSDPSVRGAAPVSVDEFTSVAGALNGSREAEASQERDEVRAGVLAATSSPLAPRTSSVKTAQVSRREAEGQREPAPVRGAKAAPEPRPVRSTPAAPAPEARQPVASRGTTPAAGEPGGGVDPALPANVTGASLTLDELCAASGLAATEVASLEGFGLIEPMVVGGALYYDEEGLTVAKLVADFARYGIEPRHLRLFRNAVDRELGLIEQVVTPLLRQRNPEARQRAIHSAGELSRLGQSLRSAILRRALRHHLGG
jgi:DNA-binding transcriptional MerR regulator